MIFQTAVDKATAEKVFRVGQNANTNTGTITAGSIALGSPVVLETNTGSLAQNFVNRPATSTAIRNNLMVGVVQKVPGTKTYLDREEVGLIQCYGEYPDAIVHRATAGASVGQPLIPNSLQDLIPVGGPVTAAATATAGHVEVPALGGLAILIEELATSSATEQTTANVFLRCM